jgi:hypothetical protein
MVIDDPPVRHDRRARLVQTDVHIRARLTHADNPKRPVAQGEFLGNCSMVESESWFFPDKFSINVIELSCCC